MADLIKRPDGKFETIYVVEGTEWDKAKNKVYNNYSKKMNIKGFRKGKVPASYVKRMIPEAQIIEDAAEAAVDAAFKNVIKEDNVKDLKLADQTGVEIVAADKDHAELKFIFTVEPHAEISQIEKLGPVKQEVSVSDEEVENQLNALLSREADWELVEDDTPAKTGDRVHVIFVNTDEEEDGEPEKEEETLVIGQGRLFKDFEDQLVGFKTGESRNISVTYPDNYVAENMRGQTSTFDITVTEIYTKEVPELNEETIAQLGINDVKTPEELTAFIRNRLTEMKDEQAENAYTDALLEELVKNTEIHLPERMIEQQTQVLFNNFARQIQANGFSIEEFLASSGSTEEAIKENMRGQAIDTLTRSYILQAIQEANNIEVTDEDIEAFLKDYAEQQGLVYEDLKDSINKDRLIDQLLPGKVIEYIKSVQ